MKDVRAIQVLWASGVGHTAVDVNETCRYQIITATDNQSYALRIEREIKEGELLIIHRAGYMWRECDSDSG